jgi:uncharacterized membrane protein HdeD (DUF308 family)
MGLGFYVTNRTSSVARGVLTLLLGVCLLVWPGFTSGLIVKLIAGFLLAIGVVTLVSAMMAASKTKSAIPVLVALNVAVYLLFGLLVFLFPGFFLSLIAFLFGGVLLIAGLSQVIGLYQSSKYAPVGGGMYIVPVAITMCGIALFFSPRASTEVLTMIFGGAVALYGISELVAVWKLRKGASPGSNGTSGDSSQQGEYTDYEEV